MSIRFPINDENVMHTLRLQPCGLSKALADDYDQRPEGKLWAHIEDMARRGLVVIENNTARLV